MRLRTKMVYASQPRADEPQPKIRPCDRCGVLRPVSGHRNRNNALCRDCYDVDRYVWTPERHQVSA